MRSRGRRAGDFGGGERPHATETHYRLKLREAFTFSQLYVKLSANTTGASTIRLRKNGADGNLATSIAASTSGNFSDTTNSDACIATDEVTLQHTWGAGGAVTQIYMSVVSSLPTPVSTTKTHRYNIGDPPPVITQVVRFQKNSSGTNGVTQDVNLYFTPKAVRVISENSNVDNTFSSHYGLSYGFSDGTNQACVLTTSMNGAAAGDASRVHRTDAVYVRLSETSNGTELERASIAFGTNKVTFTWTVNGTQGNIYPSNCVWWC